MTASLPIPLEEIPVRLRCSMCNDLARDAYRLPCCEQSICGSCQSKLPTVCKICDHSPLDAAECKVYASLRTTVTIFLRTAEKKYGSLAKAKKEATPTPQTPVEKPADQPAAVAAPEATREASLPAQADQESSSGNAEDKGAAKPGEQNSTSATESGQDETESQANNQNTQGTGDGANGQSQGGQFWNNQQGMNQYPDQSGQYQGYNNNNNNMGWNGYDQSSGYGMQGGWNNGMQNMMDQSGAMNSFNGMQSFPDGFNGMGNMNMGYGYGQGSYGNSGMGMQGQGNWGNGWNMQNGLDGSSFNSSGMNAGFYPGAGGYNHQSSYGNHQSQQNQMMPHQQFQSRGYHHNQYRNYSNQNMRGNYGQQQQQFGGPPRGNNRNYEQQSSGNDFSGAPSHGINGDGSEQNAIVGADGEHLQINLRARGDTEKVLVDEVSDEQGGNKDSQDGISSETNGATNAISLIDIRGDSQATESTDSSGTVVKENPYQTPAGDVEPQPQAPVNAPTGPRAMRERGERGRGRGRGGGFYGGRGGFHQTQVAGSEDASANHLRTGSITSSGKNGAAIGPDSDYDDASRRQSKVDETQFSPVESRRDHESHDRGERRRSRSRSRSRTRKHRHHRSRSRKRSSSPRQSRGASRDRTRSRSRDRKRHRDGDRDKDRDREKDKREKESSRSHRSHKSSSHRHRRDRSRSRSRDRKDTKERDEATIDTDAKDAEKITEGESKSSRHRDRDDDRRKDKDRDDRRRDGDKKSRKRSRSRHRSHGHHKRSRGDDEERSDRHGDDPDRKSKSSRPSRRHSTRYEDEETAAERERRVEREREEERWGKR
ncbi:hypothetical protein TWF481_009520 [Arthrobotrys musiformis]|uniref:RING-type domain-containing protein n=1 Tax=Arthrobotrys musiformis TaxID=47236 RepID=A0AAV9W4Z8_9PEZI